MDLRYMPSHISSSRNLASADATSTTDAMKEPESLSIHVSIDSNNASGDDCNSHVSSPPGQSQSSQQSLHQAAAISHDINAAPRTRLRLHTRIFHRSIGRHIRPMGLAPSDSASEYRRNWGGHIEHTHVVDPLPSRAPRPWYAIRNHPCWPGPLAHPLSLDITALMNTLVIPTQPHASTRRPRPGRNISRLVSLSEIATRFEIETGAIQTLNAAVEKPDTLKFIVLFNNYENGNHGCYRKLVVSAKTNLHLLPGHELPYPNQDTGESEHEHNDPSNEFPNSAMIASRSRAVSASSEQAEVASPSSIALSPPASTQPDRPRSLSNATETSNLQPIAVFSKGQSSPRLKEFMFLGWYEIEETEFFAAGSSDLVKMLERKSGRASKEDLESEWAKIKLVRQE